MVGTKTSDWKWCDSRVPGLRYHAFSPASILEDGIWCASRSVDKRHGTVAHEGTHGEFARVWRALCSEGAVKVQCKQTRLQLGPARVHVQGGISRSRCPPFLFQLDLLQACSCARICHPKTNQTTAQPGWNRWRMQASVVLRSLPRSPISRSRYRNPMAGLRERYLRLPSR